MSTYFREHINTIIHGDCLDIIPTLPPVDLIYIDPPWFTQSYRGEFNDKWDNIQTYLKFLKDRLILCKNVLKDTGSIYVHCDYRATAHIRLMLDKMFKFRNEIIWRIPPMKACISWFPQKHSTIYFHTKDEIYSFKPEYIQHKQEYLDAYYGQVDETGRRYRIYPDEIIKYMDELKGIQVTDVWTDISPINYFGESRHEQTGYPTQKPLKLLKRIINASSNFGDLVLDPMCGSGTTCVAAKILGRHYVGIDINEEAVKISNKRLAERGIHGGLWFK